MLDILMPETASAPHAARMRYAQRSIISVVGAIVTLLIPQTFEMGDLGAALEVLSILFFAGLIFEFVVLIRSLDELQFKIHVTALAIAGGAVTALSTMWSITALIIGHAEPSTLFALPAMVAVYYLALYFVTRHYS